MSPISARSPLRWRARCHSLPSQGRCSAGGGARLFVVCRRGERRAVGAAPQIPPAAEMYSFPGVPAAPASPPTAPPSGSDLAAVPSSPAANAAGSRTDPWAEDPHFAGLSDVFSFPRVPGASVPAVPEATTSQPSVPASQPALGTIPAAPPTLPVANLPDPRRRSRHCSVIGSSPGR